MQIKMRLGTLVLQQLEDEVMIRIEKSVRPFSRILVKSHATFSSY